MEIELPPRYALDPVNPVLGEGGMGRVLKARDVILNVPVAIKVVRPDLAADERFRKLFDLEVRIAARFAHPNIVPLHDLGVLGDGTPFLGLALADAGSFGTLRHEVLPWTDLRRLALELCDALAHLHARGVLHRDLKPENVLLYTGDDKARHAWLADLGLANASNQLAKKKGRVEGTPGFMAPEQKLGLPREYGPWTDMFSFGVILWELVTGHLPFEHGLTPLDTELPRLVPREGVVVPEGLDLVLANMLAGEPMSRYDLVADVRTELEALGAATVDRQGALARGGDPGLRAGGTVAVSAPIVSSPASISSIAPRSTPPFDERATMFDMESDESPKGASFAANVPIWNRPKPRVLPIQPIAERGLGARARASLPLFAMREIPCVARDSFRRVIWDMGRAVLRDGKSRVVLVIGEAGSGKTKLVESTAYTLEEGGFAESVMMTWQKPSTKDDGYAGAARTLLRPWNETRNSLESRLERRLGRERGALDATVKEEASMLSRWCGLGDEGEAPVPPGLGLREVYRTLEAHAWRGLSVLLLDDVQWSVEEGDGLAIAQSVLQGAQEGKEKRLLVLATIRSEDLSADPKLAQHVEQLVQLGARRLDLPRLDRRGTESILKEMLTLAPDLARKVALRCEGNPLFARQLLQEWASRNWLVPDANLTYDLAPGVDPDKVLPADAEALFLDRIAGLAEASENPSEFLDGLHRAALVGTVIPSELLEQLVSPAVFPFMRGCGLWVEKEDETLKFDHGLLHQAVKAQADARPDVLKLHRDLASAWQAYGSASGVDTSFECARHAHAGSDWRNAVEFGLKAAERAWNRGRSKAVEEAADIAIDACSKHKGLEDRVGWTVLWRARALQARGLASEAGVEYEKARAIFDERNDEAGLIEALLGIAWHARQVGELPESEQTYQDAMRRAKARKDLRAEAAAIHGLAYCEQQKRNFEGADILFTRVSNRYQSLGDQRGMALATLGQALVQRRKGSFQDAEELYGEAANIFQENDDLLGIARAKQGLAVVRRQQLLLDESEKLFREANATAEELGATDLLMETRFGLAEIYRLRGERERAQKILEAQARWAARQGLLEPAIFAHLGLATLALLGDDLQKMYEEAVLASEVLNKVPAHWLWAQYRLVVATLLALRGDEDQTYRWLWSAAELGLGDTVDHDTAYFLTIICHVAHTKKWLNVMKVSSKLAIAQWEKLRLPEQATDVKKMQTALRTTSPASKTSPANVEKPQ